MNHAADFERSQRPALAAWIMFCVLLMATALLFFHSANDPPYLDEGDHADTGRRLLRGDLMYRDAFNEKGPGLYWITAGLLSIFGDRFVVLRYASAGCVLLSMVLLFGTGWRHGRLWGGVVASALFGPLCWLFQGNLWQSEAVITLMMLSVFWLLTSAKRPSRWDWRVLMAGLALFVMTLVKQTAWLAVAAVFLALILEAIPRGKKDIRRRLMALFAGLVVPWLAILSLVAVQGVGNETIRGYLFPLVQFSVSEYGHLPPTHQMPMQTVVLWMGVAGLVALRRTNLGQSTQLLFRGLFVASGMMMVPAFFIYHDPPFLAFSSLGLAWIATGTIGQGRWFRTISLAGWGAVFILALIRTSPQDIAHQFRTDLHLEVKAATRIVAKRTVPQDRILAVPHLSTLYYLSDRQPPGKYGFLLPWTTTPEVLREFMEDFATHPPKLIFYTHFSCCPSERPPMDYMAPLLEAMVLNYRVDHVFKDGMILFERVSEGMKNSPPESCATRLLLFSKAVCHQTTAERLLQRAREQCFNAK